jgi:hypothetical protein
MLTVCVHGRTFAYPSNYQCLAFAIGLSLGLALESVGIPYVYRTYSNAPLDVMYDFVIFHFIDMQDIKTDMPSFYA